MCSKRLSEMPLDVKDGEVFKVLKKIGETGRALRTCHRQEKSDGLSTKYIDVAYVNKSMRGF